MHELAAQYFKDQSIEIPEELKIYTDYCQSLMKGDVFTWIEKKVSIPGTEIFGTADFICYEKSNQTLHVVDLKWGSGVGVEAIGNTQLRIYALMAIYSLGINPKQIELTIVQPRFHHPDGLIRAESVSIYDLIEFEADLIEAVNRTKLKDAPLVPGDHCRWCPVKAVCPELSQKAMVAAEQAFTKVELLPIDKLSETLQWLPNFEAWIKSVREYAYRQLCRGAEIPGFKLVEKRASRKWALPDDEIRGRLFTEFGLQSDEINDAKLRSVAQIEKVLGKSETKKKNFRELFSQESSGYSVVADSDRRPAVSLQDPSLAFTVIEETGETE